jgi:uncharacterized circularly permuted ATP-grasp superfamily protein
MATGLTSNPRTDLTFECPAFVFNEVFASDGTPRPQWQKFLNAYRNVPQPEFARRNEQADRMLRENGVIPPFSTQQHVQTPVAVPHPRGRKLLQPHP